VELSEHLRTIATWRLSPIPPWVIHERVPAKMRDTIRSVLLGMESDVEGKALLGDLGMKPFTQSSDADYDPVGDGALKARRVQFGNQQSSFCPPGALIDLLASKALLDLFHPL
jgi:hypothetical protein